VGLPLVSRDLDGSPQFTRADTWDLGCDGPARLGSFELWALLPTWAINVDKMYTPSMLKKIQIILNIGIV
jgi:hypothetical protein